MCTRDLYRIECLDGLKRTNKSRVFFVDGKDRIKEYLGPNWRVSRINCEKCLECRLAKAKEWAFRCVKEAKQWENNIMITLTYDDEYLPRSTGINPKTGEVYESSTLKYKDFQDFMKRLRKKFGNGIRFYACGEYGSDKEYVDTKGNTRKGTERPHYHAILFNCKFEDMREWRLSVTEWSKEKNMLYRSKTLDQLWGKGHAELNEVNFETCRYVAGYVTKKYKGSDSEEHYKLKGQVPPSTWMSRKPGIAQAFYEDNKEKFFEEKPLWAVTKKGLRKVKSRYFDKQMEKDNPKEFEKIKSKRRKAQDQMWEQLLNEVDIDKHTYITNQESKVETKNRLLKKRA